jgi:hypothetical protein
MERQFAGGGNPYCALYGQLDILKSNFHSGFLPLDFRNTTGSITNATSRLLRCCERLLTLCSALGVQQQRFSELYPFGSVLANSSLLTSIPVNTMVPTRMKKEDNRLRVFLSTIR